MTADAEQLAAVVPPPGVVAPVGAPVLDNPGWPTLTGRFQALARRHGDAARFPAEVSPFAALRDPADPACWQDLAELVRPGEHVVVTAPVVRPPAGWHVVEAGHGVQLVATSLRPARDPLARPLGIADVPEMLDLTARTKPGPFERRTLELGGYLGIREEGRLVAMAGRRLAPAGWVEISAVCTDPAWQGRGLATRLVRAVAHGIRNEGSRVFLHTSAANATAIRLYLHLGFTLRRSTTFALVTPSPDARRPPAG